MPLGAGAGVVLDTCQQAERECNHLTSQVSRFVGLEFN